MPNKKLREGMWGMNPPMGKSKTPKAPPKTPMKRKPK